MANGRSFIEEILERLRGNIASRIDSGYSDGFDEAAAICLGALARKIEALLETLDTETLLSMPNQILLVELRALKDSISDSLVQAKR